MRQSWSRESSDRSKARLPPIVAPAAASPMLVEESQQRARAQPSLVLGTSGVVARRRSQVERLDPLCRGGDAGNPFGKQPSFVKAPALGIGSSGKGSALSSSMSAGSLVKAPASSSVGLPPFPELGLMSREKGSKSQASIRQVSPKGLASPARISEPPRIPGFGGSPSRQRARNLDVSPSRETPVRSQGHNPGIDSVDRTPVDSRGSALVAELGGARSSSPEGEEQSESGKNAVRCRAVASLQRLFFEEVQRGGDPNAAAAVALKRLAEETRPSTGVPSSRLHRMEELEEF